MTPPVPPNLAHVVERFDHVSMAVSDPATLEPMLELLGASRFDGGYEAGPDFHWEQYDLPHWGRLEVISTQSDDAERTELVVLITPRAVENAAQAQAITREFRDKMEALKPLNPPPKEPDENAGPSADPTAEPARPAEDKSARETRMPSVLPSSPDAAPRAAQTS